MRTPDQPRTEMMFKELAASIGGTPLLAIQCKFRGRYRTVFAKAEHLNLTGSIKDRTALHVLRAAYERGTIQPGNSIAEATGGNMGLSFAALGQALGHPVTVFVPDQLSEEQECLIRRFGATIVSGSPDDGNLPGSIETADEMAEREGTVFLPHHASNLAGCEVHERSTGPEIWYQLKARELRPDAFVAGVGTGGTVMGVGRFLRTKDAAIRVHPVEPKESPNLSTGCKVEEHRIQGISHSLTPEVLELSSLERVTQVSDGDAILMATALAAQLGLGLGISSGANFLGALLVQEELGSDAVVATVFPDDNKRYSSIDLLGEEPIRDDFVSPEVELMSYHTLRRSCRTCSDYDECQHWVNVGFDPAEA